MPEMTQILCIETSAETCSVALTENNKYTLYKESTEPRAHAKVLTVLINELLAEANTNIRNLAAVAVSMGPGSYTGLRIGVSAAKGICYAANIPFISVPTLAIIAAQYLSQTSIESNALVVPMMDARRMEIYYAYYNHHLNELKPATPMVVDETEFQDLISRKNIHFIGSGAEKCKPLFNEFDFSFNSSIIAHAQNMAQMAFDKYAVADFS
ncbi:MAG: tRNA (adenosine(37)-N6)-threonylcarbamoyltransferase complex dimerization subunit type 1 TsaB, partial [Salinivirgaceae bacterium]